MNKTALAMYIRYYNLPIIFAIYKTTSIIINSVFLS